MRLALESLFDQLTPAARVLVAVWASTPFFLIVLVGHGYALSEPSIREGLTPSVVFALQVMVTVCTVVNVAVGVMLWPVWRRPDPVDGATLMVCLSIGGAYTAITLLAGTFTAGTNLILVGVLAIGLLLFPLQPMAIAYAVCTMILLGYDAGVVSGAWAYAAALNERIFVQGQPVWWFSLWRQFVFVTGWMVVAGLLLALFARLDHLHDKLTRLSYTDGLTGLANRRRFMDVLGSELARQRRSGQPLSVVLIDADHFKQINDRWGHLAGDLVLRQLAELMMRSVRAPSDLPARLGGEEFALILPDTRLDEALMVCERLREQVAAHPFEDAGQAFRVTVSMGVVESSRHALEALLQQADQALYEAKRQGRNRVCTAMGRGEAA